MSIRSALTLLAVLTALAACRNSAQGVEYEDPEYYCEQWASAWCVAYAECDPANFVGSFRTLEECVDSSERFCLEPVGGGTTCPYATRDETDACVEYIEANHPDGCHNLFGPSADSALCEDICDG